MIDATDVSIADRITELETRITLYQTLLMAHMHEKEPEKEPGVNIGPPVCYACGSLEVASIYIGYGKDHTRYWACREHFRPKSPQDK